MFVAGFSVPSYFFFQLANLRARSQFEYFVIGARSGAHSHTSGADVPLVCMSEAGDEFITRYFKLDAATLAQHFNAYATNHRGISGYILTTNINIPVAHAFSTGIIRAQASDTHKGDRKSAIKSVVMPILHRKYRERREL